MTLRAKVSGDWKYGTPYAKVAGTWKLPQSAWVKQGGVWRKWWLRGGVRDTGFVHSTTTPTTYPDVYQITPHSDGGFVVTCASTSSFYDSSGTLITHRGVVKFGPTGVIDTAYTANATAALASRSTTSTSVWSPSAMPATGKVYVSVSASPGLVRLNVDGTLDTSFMSNIGTGYGSGGVGVFDATDGKVFVASANTPTWNGSGTKTTYVARLNEDGTLDTSFNNSSYALSDSIVRYVTVDKSGKIYMGGNSYFYNNATGGLLSYYSARFNSDGSADTSYNPSALTDAPYYFTQVFAIHVYPNGNVLLGGKDGLRMVNSSGSIVTSWNGGNSPVSTQDVRLARGLSNGLVLIALNGTRTWSGTSYSTHFYAINEDGTVNDSWMANMGGTGSPDALGRAISAAEMPSGQVVVGGNFRTWFGALDRGITVMGGDLPA